MDKWVEKWAKKRPTPSTDHVGSSSSNQSDENIKLEDLPADPALRPPVLHYKPNERDQVCRAYLQRGACQPRSHEFPQKTFTNLLRRFNIDWFDEFPWLEYSISKDAAYCQCCYLFKRIGERAITDIFVVGGYSNWKKKYRFYVHIGGPKSSHNNAFGMCQDLMRQEQHIESIFVKHSEKHRIDYRTQLTASIDCIQHLLKLGQPFRGNDETEDSMNQGNFLETLQFIAIHNEDIEAVTLKNAPKKSQIDITIDSKGYC